MSAPLGAIGGRVGAVALPTSDFLQQEEALCALVCKRACKLPPSRRRRRVHATVFYVGRGLLLLLDKSGLWPLAGQVLRLMRIMMVLMEVVMVEVFMIIYWSVRSQALRSIICNYFCQIFFWTLVSIFCNWRI